MDWGNLQHGCIFDAAVLVSILPCKTSIGRGVLDQFENFDFTLPEDGVLEHFDDGYSSCVLRRAAIYSENRRVKYAHFSATSISMRSFSGGHRFYRVAVFATVVALAGVSVAAGCLVAESRRDFIAFA